MHVRSLGQEDPLEEGKATHSSILAWRSPWTEKPGGYRAKDCQEVDTTRETARTHAHEWLLCEWYRCFLLCCSWYPSRISHLVLLLFYFHGLRWVEDSRSLFNNTVVCLLWNVSFYQLESLSYLRKEGGFPGGKEFVSSAGDARDESSILWSDRSPGEGNDNPLQYFCLEDSMDRGAWQATVQQVAKSWI